MGAAILGAPPLPRNDRDASPAFSGCESGQMVNECPHRPGQRREVPGPEQQLPVDPVVGQLDAREAHRAQVWLHGRVGQHRDAQARGTTLLTRRPGQPTAIGAPSAELLASAQVFETMHDQVLSAARNSIAFYNPYQQVLPSGATSCKLESPAVPLTPGDVLIFIEACDPETLSAEDADPTHRHAVRIKSAKTTLPARTSRHKIVEIEWASEDALPFPLDMSCAVALGNVVLCDHGQRL